MAGTSTSVEDLTAQVDGLATSFTTSQAFIEGSLVVELNGQRLRPGLGNDYVETALDAFELAAPPAAGDTLLAQYESDVPGMTLVVPYGFDPTAV